MSYPCRTCSERTEEVIALRARLKLQESELARLKEYLRCADASGRELPPMPPPFRGPAVQERAL